MYNEDRKRAFIKDYTQSNSTAARIGRIFDRLAQSEESSNLDISQQSAEYIQNIVNSWGGVRGATVDMVMSVLREYVKWCSKNGYPTSDGVFGVQTELSDKIKRQMVSSPKHLSEVLDSLFGDDDSVNVIYKVFLWMAYSGMKDVDAIRVTSKDVDLRQMFINFEGCGYRLYEESRNDFRRACKLDRFVLSHGNYVILRKRASGDVIMRGYSAPTINITPFRAKLNDKVVKSMSIHGDNGCGIKISYNRIYLSGIFYQEYMMQKAGLGSIFPTIAVRDAGNRDNLTNAAINQIIRRYTKDYEAWKQAFGL